MLLYCFALDFQICMTQKMLPHLAHTTIVRFYSNVREVRWLACWKLYIITLINKSESCHLMQNLLYVYYCKKRNIYVYICLWKYVCVCICNRLWLQPGNVYISSNDQAISTIPDSIRQCIHFLEKTRKCTHCLVLLLKNCSLCLKRILYVKENSDWHLLYTFILFSRIKPIKIICTMNYIKLTGTAGLTVGTET